MAAIRHSGGALIRRFPAGSLWRAAVDGERPALRSLQQYLRGLHRPAAVPASFSTASTQVDISSSEPNGFTKESEEDRKKRRKMAAMMLMKSHCTDDRESEMRSINELFALLDPANDYSYSELTELQERRSLFEKKKNALLIALLGGDAEQEKEKMAELAAAGRLLRDAVSGRYQLHGQRRELEEEVADIKRHLKKMVEGQGKSVSEESAAADSRPLLERLLADNRNMLEMLDTLKGYVADNKAMLESFGEKQEELKESVDTLGEKQEELKESMDTLEEKQEELKESMDTLDQKHDELKESVDTLGEKQEELKESMDSVKDGMEELEGPMDSMKESMDSMKESMESVEESVKGSVESMEEAVRDMKETVESVEESVDDMKDTLERVESSVDKLEDTVSDSLNQ